MSSSFFFFYFLKFLTECLQHWLRRNPAFYLNWELSWHFPLLKDVTILYSVMYWSSNIPSNQKVALLAFYIDSFTHLHRYRIKIKPYKMSKILVDLMGIVKILSLLNSTFISKLNFCFKELRNFFWHFKTIVERYPSYISQKISQKYNIKKYMLKNFYWWRINIFI